MYYDKLMTIKNQFHKHNCINNKLISNKINDKNVTTVQEEFPAQYNVNTDILIQSQLR